MNQNEIEKILEKQKEEGKGLNSQEAIHLLEHEIEQKDETPTKQDLQSDKWKTEWSSVRHHFGGINNALWRLEKEPNQYEWINGGDTEIMEHEYRTFEHLNGRPITHSESTVNYREKHREISKKAGIPYQPLQARTIGIIPSERENQLVEMLFQKKIPPETLERNYHKSNENYPEDKKASPREIEQTIQAYLPWIDETISQEEKLRQEIEELETETYQILEKIIKEEKDLTDIAEEQDRSYSKIRKETWPLRERNLLYSNSSRPTEKGIKAYGQYRRIY